MTLVYLSNLCTSQYFLNGALVEQECVFSYFPSRQVFEQVYMHSIVKETNEKVRYYGDLNAYRALNRCVNLE
jgi:hypothetical protein